MTEYKKQSHNYATQSSPLTREEIKNKFFTWLGSWNNHDLEGVMAWIHEDITFNHWDGSIIQGKSLLEKAWRLWFSNHGNFSFQTEDLFIDEKDQKLLFSWTLRWPSREPGYTGKKEIRKGADILHLSEGQIILKQTYTKTEVIIENDHVFLKAYPKK